MAIKYLIIEIIDENLLLVLLPVDDTIILSGLNGVFIKKVDYYLKQKTHY